MQNVQCILKEIESSVKKIEILYKWEKKEHSLLKFIGV